MRQRLNDALRAIPLLFAGRQANYPETTGFLADGRSLQFKHNVESRYMRKGQVDPKADRPADRYGTSFSRRDVMKAGSLIGLSTISGWLAVRNERARRIAAARAHRKLTNQQRFSAAA